MNRRTLCTSLAFGFGAHALPSLAQTSSGRPLVIVIPFAPGGASDIVVRALSDFLSQDLGRPVVIENRGGAGGLIAAAAVARMPPDGGTLLYGNQGQIVAARHLFPGNAIDPRSALVPMTLVARTQFVLAVPESSPWRSADALVQTGRGQKLRFGIPGVGTPPHLATLLLGERTGVAIDAIPYQGSAPMLVDLIAGRTDAAFDNLASSLPHLRAGKLRAIGVSGARRSPALLDTPTLAEAGVPGYAYQAWQGFFAVKDTPPETIRALVQSVQRSLADPSIGSKLRELGLELEGGTAGEFASVVERDSEDFDAMARKGLLRPQ